MESVVTYPGWMRMFPNMNLPNCPLFYVLHEELARVIAEVRAFATSMGLIGLAGKEVKQNAPFLQVLF